MLYKTRNIALSLIGLLALGIPSATAMEIGVSPPRIEVEINSKTRTQSIKIVNLSSEPVELTAHVRSWVLDENNQLQEVESKEQSLDQWIVFTPARFTIPPRRSQTVRFAIRPKVKPASGEHRAVIFLEEVPRNAGTSAAVTAIGRLGVVVYGYAGEIKRIGSLNSINVDAKPNRVTAVFDVSSTGNAHVRMKGQYAVWPAAKYPGASATKPLPGIGNSQLKLPQDVLHAGDLQSLPVLAGTRRRLVLPISKKLPPGNYILDINGELSGSPIDKGIPFTVPGTAATAQPTNKPVKSPTK
ncbi:fimbria/pilus periplasmic chaperone [Scytonema sp. UIC 10036]|uniref:fimbrial biogenesis chaperone n=1 Tax=Scytonema sp. UIC 10036 TaxID=2304196 RepID=UPI0012DA7A3F|nr:fimbria/pilus periplasmic chaperone [Scytonema sp. UIC 10036]MUH00128.1 fimbria/pilus periplasmic chaperone [Scytonema sp. UIC 10036]